MPSLNICAVKLIEFDRFSRGVITPLQNYFLVSIVILPSESQFVFVLNIATACLLILPWSSSDKTNFPRAKVSTGGCIRERKTSARTSRPSSSHAVEYLVALLCEFSRNDKSARFYRILNEVPPLLMAVIVILVIVQPF